MKYNKLIILAALLQFAFTGCSYVSDYVEGKITKRASFSIDVKQIGNDVVISWTETDTSSDFAGIEIYRTVSASDENSGYETIADRFDTPDLSDGTTKSYTYSNFTAGTYLFRVGFIHWDDPVDERTADNGYTGDTYYDYNRKTAIDEISGYGSAF